MDFATIRRVWLPLIIAVVATGYIFKDAPGPHDWMRWLGLVLAFYTDWPTSFWITALSSGAYLVAVLCGNLPVKPREATASAPSG